jgi:hypothetical protein
VVRGSNTDRSKNNFSAPKYEDRLWGPLWLLLTGCKGSFPGSDVDHAPQFSAEVKNEWKCISAHAKCRHGVETQLHVCYQMPKGEMGGVCGMRGREENL